MPRTRAERRAHHARMRRRVWHMARNIWREDDPPPLYRFISCRAPCSCYMCGNIRRHWGTATVQEIRASLTWKESV